MEVMKNKKGVLQNLSNLAIGIAGLAITLIVMFLLLANAAANTDVAADANASAAVATLQAAGDQIPAWVGIVVIAAIGAAVLLLVRIFR